MNDDGIIANHQFEAATSILQSVAIQNELAFHRSHLHHFVSVRVDVERSEDGRTVCKIRVDR